MDPSDEAKATAYFAHALSDECLPVLMADPGRDICDLSVLDDLCLAHADKLLSVIPGSSYDSVVFQTLLDRLRQKLLQLPYQNYVISLSGGVDSMLHLFMLDILRKELSIGVVACHMRHSSRSEDPEKEELWVSHVCHLLQIPLYSHHVQVMRPHGDVKSGVTRDEFEDLTRKVRFSMYRKASKLYFGSDTSTVIVAHHLDDVDENRLAELGKGSVININGMGVTERVLGVTVIRPLCDDTRKDEIVQAAQSIFMPYMHNSTPIWSRRGWIRAVIDVIPERPLLLSLLTQAGTVSSEISSTLENGVNAWKDQSGLKFKTFTLDSMDRRGRGQMPVDCILLDSGLLFDLILPTVETQLVRFAEITQQISLIWNHSFRLYADECIDRSCPIQAIKDVDTVDPRAFILIEALSRCFTEVSVYLNHQLPSRSCIRNLCRATLSSSRPAVAAMLHKSCPVVYLSASRKLVVVQDFASLVSHVGGRAEQAAQAILTLVE
jgi:tRNA(Ile)-lysidine synthase TilS/MesJ